ncbi:hypothetical protein QO009_001372 [Brevibacillus aydinogluensis]|uniref:Uncharacterized protein n=1 Tax=Brevibacillus aydinogluensis TaxID=927786 RepID=A0AA48M9F6_9BACL|nr:hypothetical protein [Brevibacillus aydinogluensis]CAJ1002704.1 hypothetical protein BSPP4475_10280 [Brevibacillus aydinogluensis]
MRLDLLSDIYMYMTKTQKQKKEGWYDSSNDC